MQFPIISEVHILCTIVAVCELEQNWSSFPKHVSVSAHSWERQSCVCVCVSEHVMLSWDTHSSVLIMNYITIGQCGDSVLHCVVVNVPPSFTDIWAHRISPATDHRRQLAKHDSPVWVCREDRSRHQYCEDKHPTL